MDYVLFLATSIYMKYTTTYIQLVTAATFGAVYACLITICGVQDNILIKICTYSSVGCSNGMMEVITAEVMYIYKGRKKCQYTNILIGAAKTRLSGDNSFDMLLNGDIKI